MYKKVPMGRKVWFKVFKNGFIQIIANLTTAPLREKCPNTEYFLVCIFLY